MPCAGLGTRMNLREDQSKEMLIDPNTNSPLINYSLSICKKYDLEPIIISRKEKKDLNQYILDKGHSLIILPELSGEWMDTVLKSSNLWGENNLLLLPDTRFEPISVIQEIKTSLTLGAKVALGVHQVTDSSKWCIIHKGHLKEKPIFDIEAYAFGVIGFKSDQGFELFGRLSGKDTYKLDNTSFHYFTSFRDLTRTGKIE